MGRKCSNIASVMALSTVPTSRTKVTVRVSITAHTHTRHNVPMRPKALSLLTVSKIVIMMGSHVTISVFQGAAAPNFQSTLTIASMCTRRRASGKAKTTSTRQPTKSIYFSITTIGASPRSLASLHFTTMQRPRPSAPIMCHFCTIRGKWPAVPLHVWSAWPKRTNKSPNPHPNQVTVLTAINPSPPPPRHRRPPRHRIKSANAPIWSRSRVASGNVLDLYAGMEHVLLLTNRSVKHYFNRASCTAPGFAPECTQSAKLTCLSGSGWNFPTTLCKCKVPDKQCPELNVLKGAATRKGAAMACDNDTSDKVRHLPFFIVPFLQLWTSNIELWLLGSTCSIQCPQKNEQAYCKSSKGSRTFECKSSGDWSSNKRNDCDCRSACQSPEEQFSHISSGNIFNVFEIFGV